MDRQTSRPGDTDDRLDADVRTRRWARIAALVQQIAEHQRQLAEHLRQVQAIAAGEGAGADGASSCGEQADVVGQIVDEWIAAESLHLDALISALDASRI